MVTTRSHGHKPVQSPAGGKGHKRKIPEKKSPEKSSKKAKTAPKKQKEETSQNHEKQAAKKKSSVDQKDSESKSTSSSAQKQEDSQSTVEMLEKGFIYFFYKPKVDTDEVEGLKDVQRLYIVLWPQGHMYKKGESPSMSHNVKRIIVVPKKALPSTSSHTRFYGVVDLVSTNMQDVDKELGEKDYHNKSDPPKVSHHLQGARPVGEGIYGIVTHKGHTHLAYVLEMPTELGEVQKAMNIKHESSMLISVKNPERSTTYSRGNSPKFSDELQKGFRDLAWAPVNPPDYLNYEKAELILIGGSDDLVGELGKVGSELEHMEEVDHQRISDDKLYQELHMTRKEHPIEPLKNGEWI